MIRAGVLERNPSLNQAFIKPCVRSFGAVRVFKALFTYLETGSNEEKASAVSAMYWVQSKPDAEVAYLLDQIRATMLREFVNNGDLQVRRRIIPMLSLKPELYPKELFPLIGRALAIARSHPDEYIRHRVEIQLGGRGLYMAILDTD